VRLWKADMRESSAGIERTRNTVKGMESAALKMQKHTIKKRLKAVIRLLILMIEKHAMQRSERH
jgi:hypothetical protein